MIATTTVLVAVFVPIVFLEGTTGRLFRELAVTVSAAVSFSGLVALSLSAMLCSKLLRQEAAERPLARRVRLAMAAVSRVYALGLEAALRRPGRVALGMVAVRRRDRGCCCRRSRASSSRPRTAARSSCIMRGPEGASFDYSVRHMRELEQVMFPLLEARRGRGASSRAYPTRSAPARR